MNVEAVSLLRRQSELQLQICNTRAPAVTTAHKLGTVLHRLTAHPHALSAVLQTARALRRPPDAISARKVADFSLII
jgi:hypothetical protein